MPATEKIKKQQKTSSITWNAVPAYLFNPRSETGDITGHLALIRVNDRWLLFDPATGLPLFSEDAPVDDEQVSESVQE